MSKRDFDEEMDAWNEQSWRELSMMDAWEKWQEPAGNWFRLMAAAKQYNFRGGPTKDGYWFQFGPPDTLVGHETEGYGATLEEAMNQAYFRYFEKHQ